LLWAKIKSPALDETVLLFSLMLNLFYRLKHNIAECFSPQNLLWHFAAVITTWLIVVSGFDWFYFISVRGNALDNILFPAVVIGGLVPIVLPICIIFIGKMHKNIRTINTGWALGQAALIGWLISSTYKAFTGRFHPYSFDTSVDISRIFNFGFMREGIFWGWPSSHTTIAFAMAVTLIILYSRNKSFKYLALIYAFYVGLGVSVSIHWFSDFTAGAIIGSVVGIVVGKSFRDKLAVI